MVLAGCSTSDPLVRQIASDTLAARNLDAYDFVSLSGGRISYTLSTGDRVSFRQVADINLGSQEDCPRINAAINAIRVADFPEENSQPQDYALGQVLVVLIEAKDVANCD